MRLSSIGRAGSDLQPDPGPGDARAALLFALLIDARRVRFQRFGRLAIFLPYAVPTVIASLLWGFLYLPTVSPFPVLLSKVGLSMPNLFTTHVALLSVANIGVWGGTGFNMIVMYTALRAVPSGAVRGGTDRRRHERQIALRVKIPMIAPARGAHRGLFHHRDLAGVQRAVHPAPAHLHGLPRLEPLMPVYGTWRSTRTTSTRPPRSVVIAAVMFVGRDSCSG